MTPLNGRTINWGELALSPASDVWGIDRGTPIDRHYIELFLRAHSDDIRGRVLEVKDSHYTKTFGSPQVEHAAVIDIDSTNPNATIVADLTRADRLLENQFDCFVLTQTLHIIYDVRSALQNALRLLKPTGVLLCTLPAVSRVNYENGGLDSGDYWRFTQAAVRRLMTEVGNAENFSVTSYGNVRVCTAFLYGFAAHELTPSDLEFCDPWFPLIHCVRATKPR